MMRENVYQLKLTKTVIPFVVKIGIDVEYLAAIAMTYNPESSDPMELDEI